MKAFMEKYAPWLMLAAFFACTIAVLSWPEGDAGTEVPVRQVAAQIPADQRFRGEQLYLQPYLPDEMIWNTSLGMWQTHAGLDLACAGNVLCALSGEVSRVYEDRLWGVCVEVASGEDTVIYRSLASACVQKGAQIQAGDALGSAGAAPCEAALGAHVHLEYIRGGTALDPSLLSVQNG